MGCLRFHRTIGKPDVFANGNTNLKPVHPEQSSRTSVDHLGSWFEISLFVEHGIVREKALLVDAHQSAFAAQTNSVVQMTILFMYEPDNGDTRGGIQRNSIEGHAVVANKGALEQQIFWRIPRDRQFAKDHDITSGCHCFAIIGQNQVFVALQIANNRIQL